MTWKGKDEGWCSKMNIMHNYRRHSLVSIPLPCHNEIITSELVVCACKWNITLNRCTSTAADSYTGHNWLEYVPDFFQDLINCSLVLHISPISRKSIHKLFSKRQRITLRLLYAIVIPSVVCLSVVCCLWRWCTRLRRLNFSAIFFHHTIAQGL